MEGQNELTDVVIIVAVATLAPLIADQLKRLLTIPSTVLEIGLGVLIGPVVLDWVTDGEIVNTLANFGLAMLFFLAGYEIQFDRIRGVPLRRGVIGWLASLLLGLAFGVVVGGWQPAALVLGLAVATTALGTILPIVRDTGDLATPFGARLLGIGAVGEVAPILAVALFLSDQRPLRATLTVLAFGAGAVALGALAMRKPSKRVARLLSATLGTSVQFAVRLSILAVVLMTWFAAELGVDIILGALAAGIAIRLLLADVKPAEVAVVESKLEGIGFGLLVPFFFVVTGIRLDLNAIFDNPIALAAVPGFLAVFLLVRGLPIWFLERRDLARPDRAALACYGATQLPLVIVITGIGASAGWISSATAAAAVGAAALSVLVFPLLAQRFRVNRDQLPSTSGVH